MNPALTGTLHSIVSPTTETKSHWHHDREHAAITSRDKTFPCLLNNKCSHNRLLMVCNTLLYRYPKNCSNSLNATMLISYVLKAR